MEKVFPVDRSPQSQSERGEGSRKPSGLYPGHGPVGKTRCFLHGPRLAPRAVLFCRARSSSGIGYRRHPGPRNLFAANDDKRDKNNANGGRGEEEHSSAVQSGRQWLPGTTHRVHRSGGMAGERECPLQRARPVPGSQPNVLSHPGVYRGPSAFVVATALARDKGEAIVPAVQIVHRGLQLPLAFGRGRPLHGYEQLWLQHNPLRWQRDRTTPIMTHEMAWQTKGKS
mmetsp:Transcript_26854/g.57566  ORF Transcript_26854/g.57566 Transcript_26854/m.57566 type:complete len:227 (+) Transcript_26854:886-1566(+)